MARYCYGHGRSRSRRSRLRGGGRAYRATERESRVGHPTALPHLRWSKMTKTAGSGSEEDMKLSNGGRYRQRLNTLAANWRALALRGLVALLFGLVVLFWPGLVLAVLALLFGLYAVVDGTITFWPALRSSDQSTRRWLPLAEGGVGIIAGLIALLWPGLTIDGLVYVIVGWAVV